MNDTVSNNNVSFYGGNKTEYFNIELDGRKLFKHSYSIYVIKLENLSYSNYYYIGQTGDRHYISARPPFLRLSGHLNHRRSSTENQIYKGIAEKILKLDWNSANFKKDINNYLISSKIKMTVFPIIDFDFDAEMNVHKRNRVKVEEIENLLLIKFADIYGADVLLNKKISKKKNNYSEDVIEYVNNILDTIEKT